MGEQRLQCSVVTAAGTEKQGAVLSLERNGGEHPAKTVWRN